MVSHMTNLDANLLVSLQAVSGCRCQELASSSPPHRLLHPPPLRILSSLQLPVLLKHQGLLQERPEHQVLSKQMQKKVKKVKKTRKEMRKKSHCVAQMTPI